MRVDEHKHTGRRFSFFADPDGLPLELYEGYVAAVLHAGRKPMQLAEDRSPCNVLDHGRRGQGR